MASPRYNVIYETRRDRRQKFCAEVHSYQDPGVLLGYWFDERARIEAETEELLDKYCKNQLPFQKLDRYLDVLSAPIQLTRNLDGFLHHGDLVRLKWTDGDDKKYYLAALPMEVDEYGRFGDPCKALATEDSRLLVRNVFHVFRNDNNISNAIPLMYGERLQFATVESTGHLMLHSEPKALYAFAKQSKHQEVTWERELTARAIWKVQLVDRKNRRWSEGQFIPVNTNVVVSHMATGQLLAMEKETSIATTFGTEKEISGHTYLDAYKREGLENKWQFEAPLIKASDYGEPMVMPTYKE